MYQNVATCTHVILHRKAQMCTHSCSYNLHYAQLYFIAYRRKGAPLQSWSEILLRRGAAAATELG